MNESYYVAYDLGVGCRQEATAAGNVLIQAITLGRIASLQQARNIVRASFPIVAFHPQQTAEWHQAAEHFAKINPQL